jgi:hypothetical protein
LIELKNQQKAKKGDRQIMLCAPPRGASVRYNSPVPFSIIEAAEGLIFQFLQLDRIGESAKSKKKGTGE